jgi:hypothetical protein
MHLDFAGRPGFAAEIPILFYSHHKALSDSPCPLATTEILIILVKTFNYLKKIKSKTGYFWSH